MQVRPLVQITGEAEFNEIFIEEARIPDENIVGGVGNGWARGDHDADARARRPRLRRHRPDPERLGELVELPREVRVNGGSAAEDPVLRQRLAQLHIESEMLRLNAYRGLTKTMQSGVPGPEGSLGKWQWAEINQALTELAMEIEGAYAPSARGSEQRSNGAWQYRFLRSRANSIEGGTTEILKNIVAERVLGLPRMR